MLFFLKKRRLFNNEYEKQSGVYAITLLNNLENHIYIYIYIYMDNAPTSCKQIQNSKTHKEITGLMKKLFEQTC